MIVIFVVKNEVMPKEYNHFIFNLTPLHRLLIAAIVTVITYFILANSGMHYLYISLILWIVFAFHFMILSWLIIFFRTPNQIRLRANKDDGSTFFVFLMIFIACFVSLFIILLLMLNKEIDFYSDYTLLVSAVIAMMLSWSMMHTIYIFHYAHEYYGTQKRPKKNTEGGLNFPEDKNLDYLDFAYFTLCIGTTFQVSDVEITSKQIRRVTLLHSLLSFFMNTIVIALTINLLAGFVK